MKQYKQSETLKLLGSIENKISNNKQSEEVSHLEINEEVLVHLNIVINNCQLDSRALYKFVSNKSFGQLLKILPKNFVFKDI